jgi:hypothetical protein
VIAVEWGPVAVWVSAIATFAAAAIALLASTGVFDRRRAPRLHVTFEQSEPWCRAGVHPVDGDVLWVRVGVENVGDQPARGCVARLSGITTDGERRADVDPIQLRWAGVPPSRFFEPVDLRRGQREFVNVLYLREGDRWRIVTFEDPDFIPGFTTELAVAHDHVLDLAVFSDNAATAATSLAVKVGADEKSMVARLIATGDRSSTRRSDGRIREGRRHDDNRDRRDDDLVAERPG